jgi:DNA-binding NtrC family response regulator
VRESTTRYPYFELFPPDGAGEISRLIESIRARKDIMLDEWHALSATNMGAHRAVSEQLFRDTYVPSLRSAVESLARGDADGFALLAGELGEELARAGVSFAAIVAHLNFLKQAAAKALVDTPAEMSQALPLLDRLACAFLAAAADNYYAWTNRAESLRETQSGVERDSRRATMASSTFFHGIVGRSPAMLRVFEQIKRIALSDAPVLVLGETGTGKELVARAIHQCGPRREGPFLALNCAALPRDLIESELFGYKRGAFSGANDEGLGLFRATTGGTLLLDEITEMGPDLQAKLLRVLQERTVRPVGSVSEESVDVRIIASSNRDPEVALSSRLLRPDLYYRLSVSTVVLPPLRHRREDIAALVEYYLSLLNQRYGEAVEGIRGVTSKAMAMLLSQPWLGNVRELFNVVENAFTMCRALHIDVDDLALTPGCAVCESPPPSQLPTFAESERTLIERTLMSTGGNKLRAAQRLGISRKKLYAKIARYSLAVAVNSLISASN